VGHLTQAPNKETSCQTTNFKGNQDLAKNILGPLQLTSALNFVFLSYATLPHPFYTCVFDVALRLEPVWPTNASALMHCNAVNAQEETYF